MNWLPAYMAAGACVLAATLPFHFRHWIWQLRQRLPAIAYDAMPAPWEVPPAQWPMPSLRRRVFVGSVVPLLAALAILLAWPLALGMLLRDIPTRWRNWRNRERPFRIRRRDLRYRFTQAEVEARECVYDPLGAVPALPFGHLNAAWRRYADALEPRAQLRAFVVVMNPRSWNPVRHEGYVVVDRLGRVGAHFLAVRCRLAET